MTALVLLLFACGSPEQTLPPATPTAAQPGPAAAQPVPADAASARPPATPTPADLLGLFDAGPRPVDSSAWTHGDPPELSQADHTGAWYNGAGYRYYQSGDLPAAAALFARATQVDPDHALGHYNLACTLALIRTAGPSAVCEHGAYRQFIFDELARAVELEPKRRDRMRADRDLDSVRHSLHYELIDGADPSNPRHVHNMLVGTTVWGPGVGVYGSTQKLLFGSDGVLVEAWLDPSADTIEWQAAPGTWSMDGLTVVVNLHAGSRRLTLDPGGALLDGGQLAFLDWPSECEA